MARTAGDLNLLDSIIRNSDFNTTGNGAVATAVPCAVDVDTSMSLEGVRLGLPSTLGWVPSATYVGISGEVSKHHSTMPVQGCTPLCHPALGQHPQCKHTPLPAYRLTTYISDEEYD